MTHDPDTPPGAEATLRDISIQMEDARQALRKLRDDEVDAKQAWKAALRVAILSAACPKVGTVAGDGHRVTVRERDAWAEGEAAEEEAAYNHAKAARQAASDHLHTLRSHVSAQQTITKSVGDTYRMSGRWGP